MVKLSWEQWQEVWSLQTKAIRIVLGERDKQIEKWGIQELDPEWFLAVLTEEVGEVAKALLHDKYGGPAAGTSFEEIVQATAVGLQWIERMLAKQKELDSNE